MEKREVEGGEGGGGIGDLEDTCTIEVVLMINLH